MAYTEHMSEENRTLNLTNCQKKRFGTTRLLKEVLFIAIYCTLSQKHYYATQLKALLGRAFRLCRTIFFRSGLWQPSRGGG